MILNGCPDATLVLRCSVAWNLQQVIYEALSWIQEALRGSEKAISDPSSE
jgi:hypothetical protein